MHLYAFVYLVLYIFIHVSILDEIQWLQCGPMFCREESSSSSISWTASPAGRSSPVLASPLRPAPASSAASAAKVARLQDRLDGKSLGIWWDFWGFHSHKWEYDGEVTLDILWEYYGNMMVSFDYHRDFVGIWWLLWEFYDGIWSNTNGNMMGFH